MKKYTIEIEVPIAIDKRVGNVHTMSSLTNVKGMKQMILKSFDTETQQDMCKEYAKFHIMDMAGLKTYPDSSD